MSRKRGQCHKNKHVLDPGRLGPEMRAIWAEGMKAWRRGDDRAYANYMIQAVCAASSPWWYGRFLFFENYVQILTNDTTLVNDTDWTQFEKILRSTEEPSIFRAVAAVALSGLCSSIKGDNEQAADYCRQIIEIEESTDPKEKRRQAFSKMNEAAPSRHNCGGRNQTLGSILQSIAELAKGNLQALIEAQLPCDEEEGKRRREGNRERRAGGRVVVDFSSTEVLDHWPEDLKRRVRLGGSECDCCGKTLRELGVARLDCCSRCKMAYYCSAACQKAQWKAGHKQACRKPGDIREFDYMMMRGLQNKSELNGRLAFARKPDPDNEGRWIVNAPCGDNYELKDISVSVKKLYHIRPKK